MTISAGSEVIPVEIFAGRQKNAVRGSLVYSSILLFKSIFLCNILVTSILLPLSFL